jgi:hypothetical protein
MPVHHLLEQILYEYIAAAKLQIGQPLFQSVNSVGTEVTGCFVSVQCLGCNSEAGQGSGVPHPPLDVTPGGQLASLFTWRTTDGSSAPNRSTDGRP